MKFKTVLCLILIVVLFPVPLFAGSVYQDTNRFTYGFQKFLAAPFQIPIHLLRGTLYGPPVVGTLGGVLLGTSRTVGDLIGGVFDMAAAAAPYAKYAVFLA